MEKTIDFLEPKEFIKNVYVQTKDSGLLMILEEGEKEAKLERKNIYLFLHEEFGTNLEHPTMLSNTRTSIKGEYYITLYPLTIKKHNICLKEVIMHELAHIKYGDLERRLPPILKKIYKILVEEPRARRYAKRHQ
jgi:predicted SprT family Zn-dependent metalloprotease